MTARSLANGPIVEGGLGKFPGNCSVSYLSGSRKKAHCKKRTGKKRTGKKRTGKKRIRKRAHAEKSALEKKSPRGKKRSSKKAQSAADTIILTDHTFDYCRISVSYKFKYENVCYVITNFSLSGKRENKTTGAK